ncbi:defensin [Phymastichus coffea]|uniref:defensin n=1 Tax=Phymastichus coffea TaxID=108790 RepID=UPI00273C129A|nr:defensin [Phymastichus coffea]
MKFYSAVVSILLLVNAVYSVPLSDFEETEYGDNKGIRQRRITCDLLSPEISVKGFGGKVNNGACAANCLSMGKAGGRCNSGVCQCRKTTFADLWKQRFG